MILLNTTFCVDANIAEPFVEFIKDIYLPTAEVVKMYAPLLCELRCQTDDNPKQPTRTFALQMRAPSQHVADFFKNDILPNIYHEIGQKWALGVVMFESVLDVIHDPLKE